MSIFDTMERSLLQEKVLSGEIDSDGLLKDLIEWVTLFYYNLFVNLDTGEHHACPVSRRGNAAYALRQSFKKSMLAKLIKKSTISKETSSGIFSHLFFLTLTIDHNEMTRDEANRFITTKGKGISRFFARLEKVLDGGYSKVIVKESTTSGYPAVHIILHLDRPLKIKWHEKSRSYRPDSLDPYTRSILSKLKNLGDWNSKSPIWGAGFIDIYGFTNEHLQMKGYSNLINYIAKYISKSLDLEDIPNLEKYERVSELPEKYRTKVWTVLNNLIWNSQTWVISKSFREDLKNIKEKIEKLKSRWFYVDTVSVYNPRLYEWLGWELDDLPPHVKSKLDYSSNSKPRGHLHKSSYQNVSFHQTTQSRAVILPNSS